MSGTKRVSMHWMRPSSLWPEHVSIRDTRAELLTAAVVIVICTILFYRVFSHPVAHVPGPWLAKFSGIWRNYRYFRGTWHDDIVEVHRKYGPIVRIAPNELSVVDATVMKQLYGHGHNATKTDWYHTWDVPKAGPGFFAARDKKLHSFLRKRVSGAYAMSAILKFEPYIQSCLDLMLYRLKDHAEAGNIVNMSNWTNALAFDVVGELAYGAKLDHLETETDVMGLRKGIFDAFFIMSVLGHFPGQAQLINNSFVNYLVTRLGQPSSFQAFREWSLGRVTQRMENAGSSERDDMLAHFIRMKADNGEPAAVDEVLIEAMNIIGAGADTTSIAMRACLYYICLYQDVYAKLQKEIDDYYTANELGEPISYQQTQQLPYLVAVCKEAMRLLPSIVYQLLRYAPPGLSVNGKQIPAGTPVGMSPISANRDPGIWGLDADEFKPERWLESEQKTRYLDSMNMTFGGNGPRMCIGRNLGLVEVHKFVAQLLRHFDVGFENPDKPWHITSFWFAYQHDMNMWIKLRPVAAPKFPH